MSNAIGNYLPLGVPGGILEPLMLVRIAEIENLVLLSLLGAVVAAVPIVILSRLRAGKLEGPPVEAGVDDAQPLYLEVAPVAAAGRPDDPFRPPTAGVLVPARGLYRAWTRRDGWFVLGLMLVMALLMGPVQMAAKGDDFKLKLTPDVMVFQLGFQATMIGLVIFYLVIIQRLAPVRIFGLDRYSVPAAIGRAVLWVVPIFIGSIALGLLLRWLFKVLGVDVEPQDIVKASAGIDDPLTMWLTAATLCVGAPLTEELIFRGLLYGIGRRFCGKGWALVLSSIFFGVVHGNLPALVPLTLLGMVLVIAYERMQSLTVPVLIHMMFNSVQFSIVMLLKDVPLEI